MVVAVAMNSYPALHLDYRALVEDTVIGFHYLVEEDHKYRVEVHYLLRIKKFISIPHYSKEFKTNMEK